MQYSNELSIYHVRIFVVHSPTKSIRTPKTFHANNYKMSIFIGSIASDCKLLPTI